MPTEEQRHAFMVGWYRSRHQINYATKVHADKACRAGRVEAFIQGWLIQQLLCVLFEGDVDLNAQDMGLPFKFDHL